MTRVETNIILFCVVLCASAATLFECSLPTDITPQMFLMVVSGMAFPMVACAGARHFRNIKKSTVWKSALLAVIMAAQIVFTWDDCTYLSPGVVSAYGSLQVLIVPVLMRLLGKRTSLDQLSGVAFVFVGVVLMRGLFSNPQTLMYQGHHNVYEPLLSTVAASVLIVATSFVVKKEDPVSVTILQLLFAAIIGAVWYFLNPGVFKLGDFAGRVYGQLFVVAFFGTALLFFLNNVAQRYADATDVAIVTALEPFTLVIMSAYLPSLYFNNFEMTTEGLAGACIIAVGALVSGFHVVGRLVKRHKEGSPDWLLGLVQADDAESTQDFEHAPIKATSANDFGFQFLLVAVAFLVVAIPFKSLEVIAGVTELRPINAIPYLGGMIGGLAGALGSAVGNVGSDFFGTLSVHSIAGAFANFYAAWIPYRLWYLMRKDAPNIKSVSAAATAFLLCLASAAVVALVIGFSYEVGQTGIHVDVTKAIFFNQLVFSVTLGPPFLAVLLTDVGFAPSKPVRYVTLNAVEKRLGKRFDRGRAIPAVIVAFVALATVAAVLVGVAGMSYFNPVVFLCGATSFALFILLCI